jgi:hypothetical protein
MLALTEDVSGGAIARYSRFGSVGNEMARGGASGFGSRREVAVEERDCCRGTREKWCSCGELVHRD